MRAFPVGDSEPCDRTVEIAFGDQYLAPIGIGEGNVGRSDGHEGEPMRRRVPVVTRRLHPAMHARADIAIVGQRLQNRIGLVELAQHRVGIGLVGKNLRAQDIRRDSPALRVCFDPALRCCSGIELHERSAPILQFDQKRRACAWRIDLGTA